MKKIFFGATVACLLFLMGLARAEEVTLCAGQVDGGYDGIIRSIGAELKQQGHTVTVKNLAGSEAILNSLAAGACQYGPAQRDIYYKMTKENQAVGSQVVPASPLYNEAMQMVCSADSGYDELSDLREGDQIIVDLLGSGSALTWDIMVSIEKEYGNSSSWVKAVPVYQPLDEATASLGLGTIKCAFGVSKVPAKWAKQAESFGHTVSWVYDKDLNDLEFSGSSLYPPVRIKRSEFAFQSKFDTYKVPAVLFKSVESKASTDVDKLVKRIAPSLGLRVNTVE